MPAASTQNQALHLRRIARRIKYADTPSERMAQQSGALQPLGLDHCAQTCRILFDSPHLRRLARLAMSGKIDIDHLSATGQSGLSIEARVVVSQPQPCISTTDGPSPSTVYTTRTPSCSICFSIIALSETVTYLNIPTQSSKEGTKSISCGFYVQVNISMWNTLRFLPSNYGIFPLPHKQARPLRMAGP